MFLNSFDLQLVESTDEEPAGYRGLNEIYKIVMKIGNSRNDKKKVPFTEKLCLDTTYHIYSLKAIGPAAGAACSCMLARP